jgi:hypothetical protein
VANGFILAKVPNKSKLNNILKQAVKDFGPVLQNDLEQSVQTWNDPPKVQKQFLEGETGIQGYVLKVFIKDLRYVFVVKGTKPHEIRAKNAPMLVFPTGYTAKTTPGRIPAQAGGAFGPIRSKKVVQHPGTEPRPFPKLIKELRKGAFRQHMRVAMATVAKTAAHGG